MDENTSKSVCKLTVAGSGTAPGAKRGALALLLRVKIQCVVHLGRHEENSQDQYLNIIHKEFFKKERDLLLHTKTAKSETVDVPKRDPKLVVGFGIQPAASRPQAKPPPSMLKKQCVWRIGESDQMSHLLKTIRPKKE